MNAEQIKEFIQGGEWISIAPDGTVTITSFTPATGPMGYGNVRISMALARWARPQPAVSRG